MSSRSADEGLEAGLDAVSCVVADPLRFKRKLKIGEEAYAVLKIKNGLQALWDTGGVAATGASVAASKVVAATFFASSGGILSTLGIGAAAATPVGWVIGAAAASGGIYYGVSRFARRRQNTFVDTIPRFINTPIDLLGMQLMDMIGALAVGISLIDGEVAVEEQTAIKRHFVDEWGYDVAYVDSAFDILVSGARQTRLRDIAKALAEFQAASPDCNGEAMQKELVSFLKEIMEADGLLDEREEHAIRAIEDIFRKERAVTLASLGRSLSGIAAGSGSVVNRMRERFGSARTR